MPQATWSFPRWTGLAMASLMTGAPFALAPNQALAQDAPVAAAGDLACGIALGAPIYSEWRGLDGEAGRLGCPTDKEVATSTSPQGSQARQAMFGSRGAIVWHTSGPHAGQAYAVVGCMWRLYFQYGASSGWLGLPVGDAVNTPDGQHQAFEGGTMTYLRAPDSCEATRAPAPAPPAAAAAEPTVPLDLFEDPAGSTLTVASLTGAERAAAAHFERVRTEARVFTQGGPGKAALKLYWNEALNAHATVATAQGERDALAGGYVFDGAQGYVWSDPRPGATPLRQFRDPASGRARLVATAQGEADALAHGYAFVRIEGYAPAAP